MRRGDKSILKTVFRFEVGAILVVAGGGAATLGWSATAPAFLA
jgi:hypothetical protein